MNNNENLFGALLKHRDNAFSKFRPNLFSSDGLETLLTLATFRSELNTLLDKYTTFSVRVDMAEIEERFPFFKETPKKLSKDDFLTAIKIVVPIVAAKLSEDQKKRIEYLLVEVLELEDATIEAFVDKFVEDLESTDEEKIKALIVQSAISLSIEKGNISFGNALKQICKKVENKTFISGDHLLSEKNKDLMKLIDICIPLINLLPNPEDSTETENNNEDEASSDLPDLESFFNSFNSKF